MSDPTPFAHFLSAIDAGDDPATEAAALALSASDAPALTELAQTETGDRRWWAVRALAHCGEPDALPALIAALHAEESALRAATGLAIGHLGQRYPDAIEPALIELARLLEDTDGFVRQAAVDGFALCGDVALPVLAAILFHSEHQGARSRAAAALRHIRTMKAAPLLYRLLNDPNLLVHTYAYEALDDMGLLETLLLKP